MADVANLWRNFKDNMGSFKCEIEFVDNPQGIYYAGQCLNGKVLLTLSKAKTVKGIILRIIGRASCSFSDTESYSERGKKKTRTSKFTAEETYFESVTHLVGRNKGTNNTTLPAGRHAYSFSTALPPNLPCSFEGQLGHVRYTARVTLVRPWKFDQHCKAAFTVISHRDLNAEPGNRWPLQADNTQYYCCGLSGPLNMSVRIPARGFVPGQEVDLDIDVSNGSRVRVRDIRCSLYQLVSYHGQSPYHRVKQTKVLLSESLAPGVRRHSDVTVSHAVKLPPAPPSDLPHCNIIQVKYEIQILARVNRCHSNLDITLPITVGTIPLVHCSPAAPMTSPPVSPLNIGLVVPPSAGPSAPLLQEYPPTYEESFHHTESILERDDTKHTIGFQGFAPKYPVYQQLANTSVASTDST